MLFHSSKSVTELPPQTSGRGDRCPCHRNARRKDSKVSHQYEPYTCLPARRPEALVQEIYPGFDQQENSVRPPRKSPAAAFFHLLGSAPLHPHTVSLLPRLSPLTLSSAPHTMNYIERPFCTYYKNFFIVCQRKGSVCARFSIAT